MTPSVRDRPIARPRRGIALAVAVFAVVLIGAMMGGVLFAATQEFRVGRNAVTQERALAAAEYGINQTMNDWNSIGPNWLDVGAFETPGPYTQSSGTATVRLTRLSQTLLAIESEGTSGTGNAYGARRKAGALIRYNTPDIHFRGALTVKGPVDLGTGANSGFVDGTDTDPVGWPCVSPDTIAAAIDANPGAGVNNGTCGTKCTGSPKVQNDASAALDSLYLNYGNVGGMSTWADLVSWAYITTGTSVASAGPVVSGGACMTGNGTNWGDPDRATVCKNYYPVIYAPGDLTIGGGKGQGVLLVGGNLTASGNFRFYGPVIVRGTITTMGQGATFVGGVMIKGTGTSTFGKGNVTYSRCAIAGALSFISSPIRVTQRSWVDMF